MQEKDTAPQQSNLLLRLPEMSACFNRDSVEDVYTALQELDTEWSQATLKLMHGFVPNYAWVSAQLCMCMLTSAWVSANSAWVLCNSARVVLPSA